MPQTPAQDSLIKLNPNPLVQQIGKLPGEWTLRDIIEFISAAEIQRMNLRYIGGDGRLKELNFAIQSEAHLEKVLLMGERVDGSSLFDFVAADSSDLYVVPRLSSAFLNPFEFEPTIDFLCNFYDVTGAPLASAPQQVLRRAQEELVKATGAHLEALGELEYYLVSDVDEQYPVEPQRGYHESEPFSKWADIRRETLSFLTQMGCSVKYAHSEVGNFIKDGKQYVQQEIEFLPVDVTRAADEMTLAKWVVRKVAQQYGVTVSFSPKIIAGQAGSGMHFHTRLMKDGENLFASGDGLTDDARKVIAGYLSHAASLTAFGNTTPVSWLRLVPHQEAPTAIVWGERNRSALVRVPLGWQDLEHSMFADANPQDAEPRELPNDLQTVELRSPDGSASIHLLLAGMTVAARQGLTQPDMLEYADSHYIIGNVADMEGLELLPTSCAESADRLLGQRDSYEAEGVFPEGLLDAYATKLRAHGDADLRDRLADQRAKTSDLVDKYFHVG